ncbi:MAG: sarcosine oxidase subunit delta [Devosia sp.]|nr:sarcosine oxidase subunit delta [Devosia sp.]
MRIDCPFCGSREIVEFSYLGDAGVQRPAPDAGSVFTDYVYLRDNVAGRHREYWYHGSGCHSWLVVERDTRSHEIFSVDYAHRETVR